MLISFHYLRRVARKYIARLKMFMLYIEYLEKIPIGKRTTDGVNVDSEVKLTFIVTVLAFIASIIWRS